MFVQVVSYTVLTILQKKLSHYNLKSLHNESEFFFHIPHPIQMHVTYAKTQKNELNPKCFMMDKSFRGSV